MKAKLLSCVRLSATPWTVAYQAPPSTGVSRQDYWSGVPFQNKPTCRCWSEHKPQVLQSFRVRRPPPPPPAAPVQRAPQSRCFPREMGGRAEERRARAKALIQPTTQLLQEDIRWQRWSPWGGPAPHLCTFFLPEVHQTKTSSSWSQLNHWI